ncbi:selection and upkeep of intraepithelial T-cells protein 6-like isoform X3 [Epinephelus moara]|uniref:selection and upkeep of intraepithelial T-cells protein 6-like isoform X3 n=1 Tax=Epinephelus moara TaxID=300413 RepID=UPI00214EE95E|nr:selection and upkeep of intraepithelial T-cells protein 6-like isoform X3 [Epinephelus moara]
MMPSVIRRSFAGSQGCCNRLYFHYAVLPTLCDETTDTQKWTNRQIRPSLSLKLCPASHSMMLFHADERPLKSHLRPLSVLVFHLLLTHSCRGQSQLIGSSQPIVATVGDDIILPCRLEPAEDVTDLTLEWTRPDLNPRFVYVWRSEQELVSKKHKSFEGRTSLFVDELKFGNVSLRLSKVKLSDRGTYRCFIPTLARHTVVQVVVGVVSSPVITLAGIDKATSGVVLQCESAGWHPEPEVLWLDGEGKLLSAGPTETVRGPDDLYTVSSRVTVEKRHSNSFTCRVQQRNINQTRETHIQVPDDFFKVQSNSSIITGLAVSLAVSLAVCIMFVVLLLILLWKWRQNIIKTKRRYCGETERGQKMNSSKTSKTEDQSVPDEEREHLMTTDTVEMKVSKGKGEKQSKHIKKQRCQQQLLEEQQRREEAEKGVQTLKEELETKKKEVETKQSELQRLHEEKQRKEDELQTLKEELETKNKELETERQGLFFSPWKRKEAEKEVETLTKQLETQQMDLDTKIKKIDEKQAEVQQLQNQTQRMESNLQTLMETLSKNMELERSRVTPAHSSSSAWPIVSRQKFQEEQQRREGAENKVQILEEKLQSQIKQLEDKEQAAEMKWKKNYEELMKNNNEAISQTKRHEIELMADVKKLTEEKQRIQNERQQLQKEMQKQLQLKEQEAKEAERGMKELADKNIEWQKKLNNERTRREAAEREVEALKKKLKTKPKTNESVPVQLGASSLPGPVTVPDINSLPNISIL